MENGFMYKKVKVLKFDHEDDHQYLEIGQTYYVREDHGDHCSLFFEDKGSWWIGYDCCEKYILVKDTRLARKMFPDFEVYENGELLIRS